MHGRRDRYLLARSTATCLALLASSFCGCSGPAKPKLGPAPVQPAPPRAVNLEEAPGCAPPPQTQPRLNEPLADFLAMPCTADPCKQGLRFDECIRDDAFAGYAGDPDALRRAWCRTQTTLEQDPEHAEALSWRGGLTLFLSGFAYRSRDFSEGGRLQEQGFGDLDRSLELGSDNVGVRVQHMMSMVAALPYASGDHRTELLEAAQRDLDFRLESLTGRSPSVHTQGELWAVRVQLQHNRALSSSPEERPDHQRRLQQMLQTMRSELAGSAYAGAASCWLTGKTEAQIGCLGCHDG